MRPNNEPLPVRRDLEGVLSPWSGSRLFSPAMLLSESPWEMMRRMQTDMDRLLNQLVQPAAQELHQFQQSWAPVVDISQDGKEWLIEAELPGVEKDQICVEVRLGQLLIRAEMRQEQKDEQPSRGEGEQLQGNGQGQPQEGSRERQYHHRERRFGFFQRLLPLPDNVDEEQIHCEFRDGVLKIHLPKMEALKPRERRIPISTGAPPAAVPGQATEIHRQEQKSGEPKRKTASAGSKGGERSAAG